MDLFVRVKSRFKIKFEGVGMGKYTSEIKKYYTELGDLSDSKDFKNYMDTYIDEVEESEGDGGYPTPEKPSPLREKHRGSF